MRDTHTFVRLFGLVWTEFSPLREKGSALWKPISPGREKGSSAESLRVFAQREPIPMGTHLGTHAGRGITLTGKPTARQKGESLSAKTQLASCPHCNSPLLN